MLILLTILHKQFPELFHLENWNHVPSEQFHISFLPQPLATAILFSVYINLNILQIHNIFMISLSVMSSRYIHITACIWVFFLFRLNNCMVCVHVCIYISHFVYPFPYRWTLLGCFHTLSILNDTACTWVCKYIFEILLSILLEI